MIQVPAQEFDDGYRAAIDPWCFATSPYEQRRYDITMACLPEPRFERAFEPGCSIGELTGRLAGRCGRVVAWDASPTVVAYARQRLASLHHVEIAVGDVPRQWPSGRFDLVILSEIAYYFDVAALEVLAERAIGSLDPAGTLMAVHWLGESDSHLLHGDEVHAVLARQGGLHHRGHFRDPGFRLDWWSRC